MFVLFCWVGSVWAEETYIFLIYRNSTFYYMKSNNANNSTISTVTTNPLNDPGDAALFLWTFSGSDENGSTGTLRCGDYYLNVDGSNLVTSTTARTWTKTNRGFSYTSGWTTYYVGKNGTNGTEIVRTTTASRSYVAYRVTEGAHTAAVLPSAPANLLTSVTPTNTVLAFSTTTNETVTVNRESFSGNVCDGYTSYTLTNGVGSTPDDTRYIYRTDGGSWTFTRPTASSKTFNLDHFEWTSGAMELELATGATTPAATRVQTVRYRNAYTNIDTLPVTVSVYGVYKATGVSATISSNTVSAIVKLKGYPRLTTDWDNGPFPLYKFVNERNFNGFYAYAVASYDGDTALLSTAQPTEFNDVFYWYFMDAGEVYTDDRGVDHRYYYIRSFGNDGYLYVPRLNDTALGSVRITPSNGSDMSMLTDANKFVVLPVEGENDRFQIVVKGGTYGIGIPAVAGGDESYVLKQVKLTDHRSHWEWADTLTMEVVDMPDTTMALGATFHGGTLNPDSKILTNEAGNNGVAPGTAAEIPYGDTVTFTVSGFYYTRDSMFYPAQQRFDAPGDIHYYYYEDDQGNGENGLELLHGTPRPGVIPQYDGLTYRWRVVGGGIDGKIQILKSDGSWAALGEWVSTGAVSSVKVCMTHSNHTTTNLSGFLEVRAMRSTDSSHRLQATLIAKRDHEEPIGFKATPTYVAVGSHAPSDTGVVNLELYTPYLGSPRETAHAEWVITSSNPAGLQVVPLVHPNNVLRCDVQRNDTLVGNTSFKVVGRTSGQYSVNIVLKDHRGIVVGSQVITVEVIGACATPVIVNTSDHLDSVLSTSPYYPVYSTKKYFTGRISSAYPVNDTIFLRVVAGDQRSNPLPTARSIVSGWTSNSYSAALPAHFRFASGASIPVFLGYTVYAVAVKKTFDTSDVACFYFGGGQSAADPYVITNIYDFGYMRDHPTYYFVQDADIDAHDVVSDLADSAAALTFLRGLTVRNFRGTFNGNYHKLKHLVHPLMDTISKRGSVSNLVLEDVWIDDQSSNVSLGAVARVARQGARIYNVGSRTSDNFTVAGQLRHRGRVTKHSPNSQTYVGGLVGRLLDTARVINCYSDADVVNKSTSTSSHTAGLVGYNNTVTTQALLQNSNGTMVMNCVCYADSVKGDGVKGSGSLAPVYGGKPISNDNVSGNTAVNTYTYYCADMAITKVNGTVVADNNHVFNGSIQMSDMHFGRWQPINILNSNRRLCAVYIITDRRTPSSSAKNWIAEYPGDTSYVGKWVVDDEYKYPVIKKWGKYPSLINPRITSDAEFREPYCGRKLGTLTVHVRGKRCDQSTNINEDLVLPIMDIDTGDAKHMWSDGFGAGKYGYAYVSLPFYSSMFTDGYGVSGNNRTVTGWKITAIETDGSVEYRHFHTTNDDSAYNFADRYCIDKDLFSTMNDNFSIPRVFACGGYYYVPEGVTAITIEPYWSRYTVYICDYFPDRVASHSSISTLKNFHYGGRLPNASKTYLGKTVLYNTTAVMNDLNTNGYNSNGACVYDNAVVLVGNYHDSLMASGALWTNNKHTPFTILSANDNQDDEPAYTFYVNFGTYDRLSINPVCFTFINVCGLGMAKKTMNQAKNPTIGIWQPYGWFEFTETAFAEFTEFEYANSGKQASHLGRPSPLILNGGTLHDFVSSQNNPLNTPYIIVGGNIFMYKFANGVHFDSGNETPHNPVNIIGGQFKEVYLSGNKPDETANTTDHVQLYTNGGKIGFYATGGQAQIKGNATLRIDHTIVRDFYGGGVNPNKPVTGNIDVRITNSLIGTYFGGPQYGNMTNTQTIKTYAENTTFGYFYGAGHGGTGFSSNRTQNSYNATNRANDIGFNSFYDNRLSFSTNASYPGFLINYDYDFMCFAGGNYFLIRFYNRYAIVSLTQTYQVTSYLKDCKVMSDFYGGGRFGSVGTQANRGSLTTTLENTEVFGRVFGGSYASSTPTAEVSLLTSGNVATYRPYYSDSTGYFGPATYAPKETWMWQTGTNGTKNDADSIFYTNVDLSTLGQVFGNINLTIKGTSNIHGDVFGGCDMSTAKGNVVTRIMGPVHIGGSLYGGGNEAKVIGNTTVKVGEN